MMQQSATGTPAVTANATIVAATTAASSNNVKHSSLPPPPPPQHHHHHHQHQQQHSQQLQQSSMDHTNISRANNAMKDVDAIHFTSSQSVPVTTAAAQVITVIAPSSQSTEMISSQPVVVQVSSGNQYIAVSVPGDNVNNPVVAQSAGADDPEDAPHTTYEEYNPVFTNGSNTAGQMTYYAAGDTYPPTYYNSVISDGYLVMDQTTAASNDPTLTIPANCHAPNREGNPNIIASDDEYNKSYHQTRMSVQPQTIYWLNANYETADGVSLPRSTLYSHYQAHCQQNNLEPVNAASFGKLIRSVFIGLRTRRLGTRGNSKYHYYGIRIKPSSSLARIGDPTMNGIVDGNSTMPPVKRTKLNNNASNKSQSTEATHVLPTPSSSETLIDYLGDSSELLNSVWPSSQSGEVDQNTDESKVLHTFTKLYRAHFDRMIKALSALNFQDVEMIWHSFWQCSSSENNAENLDYLSLECVRELSKTHFSSWIAQTDYTMYNAIISDLLLPNLLKPIPQMLTQQIRNFAKCMNKWMINALQGYDDAFIQLKTAAVSSLSHMLRRYTSLNHLSTAACAVLKNQQQVTQMISDLNKVDFKNVQEQASWVCQCDDDVVRRVESSFKTFLQECNPHEKWAEWCERVLQICLPDDTILTAKQFFFKWEFYSSLVMRDLTLRSAASFGSFHLIRLLYDEYIFYLIEQRIAKAARTTPLQMLGESRSLGVITAGSHHHHHLELSSVNVTNSVASTTATTTSVIPTAPTATTTSNTTTEAAPTINDNGNTNNVTANNANNSNNNNNNNNNSINENLNQALH